MCLSDDTRREFGAMRRSGVSANTAHEETLGQSWFTRGFALPGELRRRIVSGLLGGSSSLGVRDS